MTAAKVSPPDKVSLDEKSAKQLTNRIKGQLRAVREAYVQLPLLVQEAYDGQAWEGMGYDNWFVYLAAEFTPLLASINAVARRDLVPVMPGELTKGELAEVFGVDARTIQRDRNPKTGDEAAAMLLDVLTGEDEDSTTNAPDPAPPTVQRKTTPRRSVADFDQSLAAFIAVEFRVSQDDAAKVVARFRESLS